MKNTSFELLGLDDRLLQAVSDLGFVEPTPIQQQAIPVLLEDNRDLIGLAQTGTGKTAAFGLPLLQKVDLQKRYPQALVLAPTRELCVQISNDLVSFSTKLNGFGVVAVYGGASITDQMSKIRRGVQVVVATPGRLIDLIERGAIKLDTVDIVVLDEADEMLNMGFKEDIDFILSNTPDTRNTWLFSATMPKEVRAISKNYMENPAEVSMGKREEGNDKIEHQYYVVRARDRYPALKRIADANPDLFAIVFCRTKIETQEVAEHLIRDGYNADALHGDLSQQQRDKVMGRYREKSLQMLVATDVAARGIDVQDVTHVIHYNLPDELENYMHRSGRTARAGKSGVSISIVHTKEAGRIRQIEKQLNKTFKRLKVPTGIEVCEKQLLNLVKRVHNVTVDEKAITPYLPSIYQELEGIDREELIARFVSIEFNRFLEYYKNATDLNADEVGNRGESGGFDGGYRSAGPRLFINIGSKDGLDRGRLLRFLCDESGEKGFIFGRLDVKGVYSFADVQADKVETVMKAINGSVFAGRNVRAELTDEKSGGGGGRSSGGGGYAGKKKSYGGGGGGYERSDRGDRGDRGGERKSYGTPPRERSNRYSDAPAKPGGSSRKDKFKKW